jgi:hypothetical protein
MNPVNPHSLGRQFCRTGEASICCQLISSEIHIGGYRVYKVCAFLPKCAANRAASIFDISGHFIGNVEGILPAKDSLAFGPCRSPFYEQCGLAAHQGGKASACDANPVSDRQDLK